MTLMFTQSHRVTEKVEVVQSLRCKMHKATQMFVMVDYVRKMTVKTSCNYGEYGLFEHLLFLGLLLVFLSLHICICFCRHRIFLCFGIDDKCFSALVAEFATFV